MDKKQRRQELIRKANHAARAHNTYLNLDGRKVNVSQGGFQRINTILKPFIDVIESLR